MYDIKKLQDAFVSLVGVRQSNVSNVPEIDDDLSYSITGIYIDDKNPIASTENLYYSSPNFQPSTYPMWKSGSNYAKNIVTNDNGALFICINPLVNDMVRPSADNINWSTYNPYNIWVKQKYNQAVSNMMSAVISKKKLSHMAKAVLEKQQLYRGFGSIHNKIIAQGRFVGVSILPQQADGLLTIINQVGIQLTKSQEFLKFYLYHSDCQDAIGVWEIPIINENTFNWQPLLENSPLPWIINSAYEAGIYVSDGGLYFKSNNIIVDSVTKPSLDKVNWSSVRLNPDCIMKYLNQNTSGVYYFGYYESDLVGQALSKSWDCTASPCYNCDGGDVQDYNRWSRYTSMQTICVSANDINEDRTIFDTKKVSNGNITNWGINLNITVRCDLTDFMIENKLLFADTFAFQVCKEFLESIATTTRLGPDPAQTKLSAIAALDAKAPGNWIKSYNDNIDSLNLDLSGFSNACMTCNEKGKKTGQFIM